MNFSTPSSWPVRLATAVTLTAIAGASIGCTDEGKGANRQRVISVFAAASLTEAFGDIERSFEAAHPNVDVVVTYAGSQVLRLQIEQGAPADVFASANADHMEALVATAMVSDPTTFVHNELALIVPVDRAGDHPSGRSGAIGEFGDLPKAKRIVVGKLNVPVGRYTEALLVKAAAALGEGFMRSVRKHVVSRETNVRMVRAKVALGEADAAFVYRTDVTEDVATVPIPAALNVSAAYSIGIVGRSKYPGPSNKFITFVHSADGQRLLHARGFVSGR